MEIPKNLKAPFEIVFSADVSNITETDLKKAFESKGALVTRVNKKRDDSGAYIRFKTKDMLFDALGTDSSEFGLEGEIEYNDYFDKKRGVYPDEEGGSEELPVQSFVKNNFSLLEEVDE